MLDAAVAQFMVSSLGFNMKAGVQPINVSIPTRREEEWAKGMNPFVRLAFCLLSYQEATHNCSQYLLMSCSQKGQHGRALSLASSKVSSFSWKLALWSHYLYHGDWQVSQVGAFSDCLLLLHPQNRSLNTPSQPLMTLMG